MWWTWGTLVPISRWSIRHRLFFRSSNWNWFCGDIYRIYCWYALNTFSSFLSPNSSTAFQIFKSLRLEDFPPWWMTSGNTDYWKLMWKWIKLKHGCFFLWNRLLTSLLFTNKKLYCIQACMKFLYPASKLLPKTQSESFTASLVLKSELATFEALQAWSARQELISALIIFRHYMFPKAQRSAWICCLWCDRKTHKQCF